MNDSAANNPKPENRLSTILQSTTHFLVVGAGLVYLFGFLVMSVYDATYGIVNFSLFRPRVIAVGTLFAFLILLLMLITFRAFALFGLGPEEPRVMGIQPTPENRLYALAYVAFGLPAACFGLTWLLTFLFSNYPETPWQVFAILILEALTLATLAILGRNRFNTHPLPFVALSFFNAAALLLVLFVYADRTLFWFVLWSFLVCVFTLTVALKFENPNGIRKTEWERLALVIIPLVFFAYATKVYPKIRHEFGGGAPTPIILHLTKKLPPFDSDSVSVSLIDETEDGYYVLFGESRAEFVTRTTVEEIEFVSSPSRPQK
jgi:hypothetical protein